MKLKDINPGENEQEIKVENEYVPGSSEKKRACVMYLFFGVLVSLSKKEFNPFEFYHLKQAIGLWILLLPMILVSFVPVLKWISIVVLVALLGILGRSFANAFNGKYFDNSKNIALILPAGIGGWFLDLFELGIKSTGVDGKKNISNQSLDSSSASEIEKDLAGSSNDTIVDESQAKETTLEEDVEALDKKEEPQNDGKNK